MPGENLNTFLDRIQHLNACARSQIKGAYKKAKDCFRGHLRKQTDEQGSPIRYFEHLRGAALILMDDAQCLLPEMIIATLMHDALEDTRDVNEDDLQYWFYPYGWEVLRIVRILSKSPGNDYLRRMRTFGDWKILLVKACDRLHNLRTLDGCTREFQLKQAHETRDHYIHLLAGMIKRMPTCYIPGSLKILDEIEQLTNRYHDDNPWIPETIPEHWKAHYKKYR